MLTRIDVKYVFFLLIINRNRNRNGGHQRYIIFAVKELIKLALNQTDIFGLNWSRFNLICFDQPDLALIDPNRPELDPIGLNCP